MSLGPPLTQPDPDLAFSVAVEPGSSREVYYGDARSGKLTRLSYRSGEPV